jgi:hypothetical protein
MNAIAAEFSLYEESDLDETELELSTTVRFQFKDAYEFGRACRSLAIPVNSREEFAAA